MTCHLMIIYEVMQLLFNNLTALSAPQEYRKRNHEKCGSIAPSDVLGNLESTSNPNCLNGRGNEQLSGLQPYFNQSDMPSTSLIYLFFN